MTNPIQDTRAPYERPAQGGEGVVGPDLTCLEVLKDMAERDALQWRNENTQLRQALGLHPLYMLLPLPPQPLAGAVDRAEVLELLDVLVPALEEDFGPTDDGDEDAEPVGASQDRSMALTFGMIRRAQKLRRALALPGAGSEGEVPPYWPEVLREAVTTLMVEANRTRAVHGMEWKVEGLKALASRLSAEARAALAAPSGGAK